MRRSGQASAVVGFLLALALAGCTDDGADATAPANQTADQGTIAGIVVDDAIRPLAGAALELLAGDVPVANATTDEDGAFRLDGIEPGAYVLSTRKFGYLDGLSTVTATTDADAPLVQVVLRPDPLAQRPYYQSYTYEGFMDCATTFASPCQFLNSSAGVTQDSSFFSFVLAPQPAFVQTEFVWESTSAAGQELEFYLEVGVDEPGCTSDFELGVMGPSPLQTRIPGLDLGPDRGGSACDFHYATYAGDSVGQGCVPYCAGATVSQSFRVYLTAFYGYEPPAEWKFSDGGGVPPPPPRA